MVILYLRKIVVLCFVFCVVVVVVFVFLQRLLKLNTVLDTVLMY